MATAQLNLELKNGMLKLQSAFSTLSARRQEYVISAIVLRESGNTFPAARVAEFTRARGALTRAAYDLDLTLQSLKAEDQPAYLKVIGSFNDELRKSGYAKSSSESVLTVIEDALPEFPMVLLNTQESPAVQSAIQIEKANYAVQQTSLGFIPAIATGITGVCQTAIAASAVTGFGALVVGVGCALLITAAVVGALYFAYKAVSELPRLVMAFSPQAAASMAEAERLKSAAEYMKSVGDIDPATRAKLAAQLGQQPEADKVPWALVGLIGALAVFVYLKKKKDREQGPVYNVTPSRNFLPVS